MNEENLETTPAEVENVDGANNDNNASVTDQDNDFKKAFEDQKGRAAKAEKELADLKAKLGEVTQKPEGAQNTNSLINNSPQGLSREEAILFAKGLTPEEVDQAEKIAKLEGVSLTEAINNDLFTLWKEKKDAEDKAKKAQLGASNGSPTSRKKKDISSSGLSKDEHKALWREKMGV